MMSRVLPIPFPPGAVQRFFRPVLGVSLAWYQAPSDSDEGGAPAHEEFFRRFREVIGGALKRQRRKAPEFWDAMSYLERAGIPEHLAHDREARVAMDLIASLKHGRPREQVVRELTKLPLLACSRSRLVLHRPGDLFATRWFTPRIGFPVMPWLDPDPRVRHGFHRVLEVDMTALGVDPSHVDAARLVVIAVLVQLHAELEVFYETGFWRIRRCERASCGAWFCAKRMDSRSKFCSTTCRVGNARESARRSRPGRTTSV